MLHEEKLKTRIMIIDDEAPIRQILSDSLKDEGYHVLTARLCVQRKDLVFRTFT